MHSSLKDSDVGIKAIVTGHSVYLPYAISSAQLIQKLKLGEQVNRDLWFQSDNESSKCGFKSNPSVAKIKNSDGQSLSLIYRLIDNALEKAQLSKKALTGNNVRFYLTGSGPRIDGADYKFFYNNNDIEDIECTKSIAHMHAKNMSQDFISHHIARHYQLRYMPPSIHSASNSSLVAIYLACQAIEKANIDIAVIINCSKVQTQDLWFLEKQSTSNGKWVQPFGEGCNGVLFSEGLCVMILESEHHGRARNLKGSVCLNSVYTHISASRSNDTSWMSINIIKLMSEILNNVNISANELCAIMPHGNGTSISDKAEENAIISFLAGVNIPVLAYKGQIGYTSTGSGIIDLIIGEHTLLKRELLSPVGQRAITRTFSRHVLINRGILKHSKKHLLKLGIGMDGSIIALLMTDNTAAGPDR